MSRQRIFERVAGTPTPIESLAAYRRKPSCSVRLAKRGQKKLARSR